MIQTNPNNFYNTKCLKYQTKEWQFYVAFLFKLFRSYFCISVIICGYPHVMIFSVNYECIGFMQMSTNKIITYLIINNIITYYFVLVCYLFHQTWYFLLPFCFLFIFHVSSDIYFSLCK